MTIRSSNNKRTQNQEYTGMARKSAASAKPARAAAGSVRVVPSSAKARRKEAERGESLAGLSREEKRARKQEERRRDDRIYTASNIMLKKDPEYKHLRTIFWVLLAIGMVIIIAAWAMMFGLDEQAVQDTYAIQLGCVIVAYVFIIGTFIFDFVKIRPLRNFYRSQAEGMPEKKIIALIEQEAAEPKGKKGDKDRSVEPVKVEDTSTDAPVKKTGRKKNHRSRR
ncbi:hypothetical protein [Collinsella sp. An2]|uniref:hypothetical protein n=1 Tax=Collinsella sp. An2 TaxID=1965585 RepID=UPI0019508CE6|nr:hypothetical protein [Collinsella sp. An2]